jgi:hypothetical protein
MTDWDFLTIELATLDQVGLLARPRTVKSAQGVWMAVDGKRVLNLLGMLTRTTASGPIFLAAPPVPE